MVALARRVAGGGLSSGGGDVEPRCRKKLRRWFVDGRTIPINVSVISRGFLSLPRGKKRAAGGPSGGSRIPSRAEFLASLGDESYDPGSCTCTLRSSKCSASAGEKNNPRPGTFDCSHVDSV